MTTMTSKEVCLEDSYDELCERLVKEYGGTGWVPISEALPTNGQGVLVTVKGYIFPNYVASAVYRRGWFYVDGDEDRGEVLAWRALPAPYNEHKA